MKSFIFNAITFLKWFPKTFHLHGIHSPFIYTLEKKCLREKTPVAILEKLQKYREKLAVDDRVLEVTDFGAGSRVFTSDARKVSQIARYAGATQKRTELLARLVAYLDSKKVLELGTSLGMATCGLASMPQTQVLSLEGCPETAAIAHEQLAAFGYTNVEIIIDTFKESLPKLTHQKFDLIYFDGNHSKDATLEYARQLLPTAHNTSVWIFDDIHWSQEMTAAWKEIKSMQRVTASVDCFWFGIIFFRKEQLKEEFQIRL